MSSFKTEFRTLGKVRVIGIVSEMSEIILIGDGGAGCSINVVAHQGGNDGASCGGYLYTVQNATVLAASASFVRYTSRIIAGTSIRRAHHIYNDYD